MNHLVHLHNKALAFIFHGKLYMTNDINSTNISHMNLKIKSIPKGKKDYW